jgi:hypothetical protein
MTYILRQREYLFSRVKLSSLHKLNYRINLYDVIGIASMPLWQVNHTLTSNQWHGALCHVVDWSRHRLVCDNNTESHTSLLFLNLSPLSILSFSSILLPSSQTMPFSTILFTKIKSWSPNLPQLRGKVMHLLFLVYTVGLRISLNL